MKATLADLVPRRHGRRHPYTQRGVERLPCTVAGCQNRAHASWQICADNRLHRPICLDHDIELNRMVLRWMGDPEAETKMATYRGANG